MCVHSTVYYVIAKIAKEAKEDIFFFFPRFFFIFFLGKAAAIAPKKLENLQPYVCERSITGRKNSNQAQASALCWTIRLKKNTGRDGARPTNTPSSVSAGDLPPWLPSEEKTKTIVLWTHLCVCSEHLQFERPVGVWCSVRRWWKNAGSIKSISIENPKSPPSCTPARRALSSKPMTN